ncbi:replication initiation protein, partial [Enterobacter cloacae complex sp. LZL005]|uniref:replication initiation protein n=1 Tax=Enterobacter cloacae complex sp. LZL005 TaxID=3412384 RepID=UPI003B9BD7DF
MSDLVAYKSNALIEASYKLTLQEQRFLLVCISRLKWHCCKVSDEAAFCLIQRPYISKTLLTRRISPRGSP